MLYVHRREGGNRRAAVARDRQAALTAFGSPSPVISSALAVNV